MRVLSRQDVTPRGLPPQSPVAKPPSGGGAAVVAMAALIVLPVVLAWGGWRFLTTTRALTVRTMTFTGTVNASQESLRASSCAMSRNALALDLAAVRGRLLGNPWIADAVVRRALPHELRVTVTERVPAACEASGDVVSVLDAEGRVLEAGADPARFPLPLVTGIGALPERKRDAARARAAATLAALQAASADLFSRVESLDASLGDKLVVTARDCPPLWLSGPESADEAAAWAARRNGIGQAIGRALWVDARWRDRLYVMPDRS